MIERRCDSRSARLTVAAFSASKVSVNGQIRTLAPGSKTAVCAPETSTSPTTQLFRPTFSRWSFPSLHPHDGVVAGDERTGEHHGVRRIATDGHVRDGDLDHGPPAFIDLVEPDFHAAFAFQSVLGLRGCRR